jgi:hypothetical protein
MILPPELIGAIVVAVPALLLSWVALRRRQGPVVWLAFALILVGTGYLMSTGATGDIAGALFPGVARATR